MAPMTRAQSDVMLMQAQATYVTTRGDVEWWKLPDKSWVGRRSLANGMVQLARQGCNC